MRVGAPPAIQGPRDSPPVPGRWRRGPFPENWRGTRRSGRRCAAGDRANGESSPWVRLRVVRGEPILRAGPKPGEGAGVVPGVLRSPRTVSPARRAAVPGGAGSRGPPRPVSAGPSPAPVPPHPATAAGPRPGTDRRSPPAFPRPPSPPFPYSPSPAWLFGFPASRLPGLRLSPGPAGRAAPSCSPSRPPGTAKRPILAGQRRNSAPQDPPNAACGRTPRFGPPTDRSGPNRRLPARNSGGRPKVICRRSPGNQSAGKAASHRGPAEESFSAAPGPPARRAHAAPGGE
jgi:hypothetical protein